jgi:hypothetical protein
MENYAKIAGPLTNLLTQTSQRIKLFEKLKSNLLHAPILA